MKYSGTLIILCILSFAVLIGLNIMNAQERREDMELHKTVEAQTNKEIEELKKRYDCLRQTFSCLNKEIANDFGKAFSRDFDYSYVRFCVLRTV